MTDGETSAAKIIVQQFLQAKYDRDQQLAEVHKFHSSAQSIDNDELLNTLVDYIDQLNVRISKLESIAGVAG